MAKLEFKKNDNRPNRKRELRTAEIPEPTKKYSPEKAREEFKASQSENDDNQNEEVSKETIIESKKQVSKTVRISEYNIDRMRALETILRPNSHNDMMTMVLDHFTTTMSQDEISTYKLLMNSFNKV